MLVAAPLRANESTENVRIPLRPLAGMRLPYRNDVVTMASGPSREIVDKHTVAFVLDVLALDASGCLLNVTLDGTLLPVTARLSHSADLEELVFDASVTESRRQYLAVLLIAKLTRFSVVNAHSWASDESRPAVLSVPLGWESLAPAMRINFVGDVTFRRIGTIFGRSAAEFDLNCVIRPRISELAANLEITGHYWADLATGFLLRLSLSGVGNVSAGGKTARVEQTQEDVLVLEDSKGL